MASHGTRHSYNQGCRCAPCSNAQSAYQAGRKAGSGPLHVVPTSETAPDQSRERGPVEAAVWEEIKDLPSTKSRPGLTELALSYCRIIDDPNCKSQHAANGHRLRETLTELCQGSGVKAGSLASVRTMTKKAVG